MIKNFIVTIQNDKDAFEIFREEALKKGLIKDDPLPQLHHRYYKKYIKNSPDSLQSSSRYTS